MKKPSARETRGAILLTTLTAAVLAVTLTLTSPSGDTLPPPAPSEAPASPISAGASAPASSAAPADSISPISPKSPKKSKKSRRRGAAPAPALRSPLDEPAH